MPSPDPVAKRFRVELVATEMTVLSCPSTLSWACPVPASQNRALRSFDPDMTHALSRVSAADKTKSYQPLLVDYIAMSRRNTHIMTFEGLQTPTFSGRTVS